jgi:hypothetical protein
MCQKDCHKEEGKMTVAKCEHCDKCWTNNDLVLYYLQKKEGVHQIEKIPDTSNLLRALCFEATKPGFAENPPISAIHANSDLHASKHVGSCFKKNKIKKIRKRERPK